MIDFEHRLENWGDCYRNERARPSTSPTYDVCRQIAIQRGGEVRDGYRTVNAQREIDEDDARIIEWCWRNSAYRMDQKHWPMLRAHYVERSDRRLICRVLQIRFRSFDSELANAIRRFQQIVAMLEGCKAYENAR